MSQITELFENPLTIVISCIAVIYAIKEFDSLVKWFKEKLNGYHEEVKEDEDLKGEVKNISYVSAEHTKTLQEITEAIKNINLSVVQMNQTIDVKFQENKEREKINQVISDRATLYQLYKDMRDRDALTLAEYESFHNIAERYLSNGGNGAFRGKIIPLIESKSISDDQ